VHENPSSSLTVRLPRGAPGVLPAALAGRMQQPHLSRVHRGRQVGDLVDASATGTKMGTTRILTSCVPAAVPTNGGYGVGVSIVVPGGNNRSSMT
jgi:hypothetical protein